VPDESDDIAPDQESAPAGMKPRSRRAHGDGGPFQRSSDDLWVGVVDLGWIDGKRTRRTVYGRTQKKARDKMRALRDAARRAWT
jgi:integrase